MNNTLREVHFHKFGISLHYYDEGDCFTLRLAVRYEYVMIAIGLMLWLILHKIGAL